MVPTPEATETLHQARVVWRGTKEDLRAHQVTLAGQTILATGMDSKNAEAAGAGKEVYYGNWGAVRHFSVSRDTGGDSLSEEHTRLSDNGRFGPNPLLARPGHSRRMRGAP